MKRFGLALAGMLLAGTLPASAGCKLGTVYFDFQQYTTTEMEIGSGEYCAGQFRIPRLVITQAVVLKQPKNGLVSFDQKTYVWKYRSFAQFKGEDQFMLRIHGYNDRKNGDGTVVFRVKVR